MNAVREKQRLVDLLLPVVTEVNGEPVSRALLSAWPLGKLKAMARALYDEALAQRMN